MHDILIRDPYSSTKIYDYPHNYLLKYFLIIIVYHEFPFYFYFILIYQIYQSLTKTDESIPFSLGIL